MVVKKAENKTFFHEKKKSPILRTSNWTVTETKKVPFSALSLQMSYQVQRIWAAAPD